jgi:hypothetical protein
MLGSGPPAPICHCPLLCRVESPRRRPRQWAARAAAAPAVAAAADAGVGSSGAQRERLLCAAAGPTLLLLLCTDAWCRVPPVLPMCLLLDLALLALFGVCAIFMIDLSCSEQTVVTHLPGVTGLVVESSMSLERCRATVYRAHVHHAHHHSNWSGVTNVSHVHAARRSRRVPDVDMCRHRVRFAAAASETAVAVSRFRIASCSLMFAPRSKRAWTPQTTVLRFTTAPQYSATMYLQRNRPFAVSTTGKLHMSACYLLRPLYALVCI